MTLRKISIDLETLGTGPDARILSIGACEFDELGVLPDNQFYVVIDIEAKQGGGSIDASTVCWWMRQSEAARDAIFGKDVERISLPQALIDLSEWLGFNDELPDGEYPDIELWARGNKDEQWLTSAYEGCGYALPYRYWMWKDQRTMTASFKQFLPDRLFHVEHNALDDAQYQAQCLVNVFDRLRAVGAIIETAEPVPVPPAPPAIVIGDLDVPLGVTDAEPLPLPASMLPAGHVYEANEPLGVDDAELAELAGMGVKQWPVSND